jgi:hypothetical protein
MRPDGDERKGAAMKNDMQPRDWVDFSLVLLFIIWATWAVGGCTA